MRAFGAADTDAGVYVDEDAALSSSAIWAGIRLISESLSTVPLHVYRMGEDGQRRVMREHPVDPLLYSAPNPEMTAQEWRSQMMAALILSGNGYSEIVRDRGGRIRQLWPLSWYRVELERAQDETLYYEIQTVGLDDVNDRVVAARLPSDRVLHLRSFNARGLLGDSMVQRLKQTIGITIATEKFGANFYGQGTQLSGVLSHPGSLSEGAQKRLRDSWNSRYQGVSQSHRVAILEEGMKWDPISVPPEASQFLQTREFQIQEAARALNLPPHMLRDLSRATFSNVEQQAIEFVVHSLRPWAVILEQRMQLSLLTEAERRSGYYIRHNLEGLLRGDIKTRYESYAIGRNWGWLSANDVRELEDLNPIESGDVYLQPLNMVEAGMAPEVGVAESTEPDTGLRLIRSRPAAISEQRQTDFPTQGDDETVTLSNSQYTLPPLEYVNRIREEYPEIWGRGGNVEGNRSDRILREIREDNTPAGELTPTQVDKIREREAWSARHFEDFRLNGVVAQLKWHTVGSRGFDHMRETIDEAIERLERERSVWPSAKNAVQRRSLQARQRLANTFRPLLREAFQTIAKGEARAIRSAVEREFRGVDSFRAWVEGQYGPQFAERIVSVVGPIVRSYQEQVSYSAEQEVGGEDPWPLMQNWVESYLAAMASRYAGYSQHQLIALLDRVDPDQAADDLLKLAEHWEESRADDATREEITRAGQGILRTAYATLGVAALRWVADADPCDFCAQVNGTVVTIAEPFASDGLELEGGEGQQLRITQTIRHPPLHKGCECQMIASS